MKYLVVIILAVSLSLLLALPLYPGVYKWVDDDGNVQFSDTPRQGAERQKFDRQEFSGPGAASVKQRPGNESSSLEKYMRPVSDVKVTMYYADW